MVSDATFPAKSIIKPIARYFLSLDQLQQAIFSIFLAKDYPTERAKYEIKLHTHRKKALVDMQKAQQICKTEVANKLNQLYEIIISLHRLSARVRDYSLMSICERELKDLTRAISFVFKKIIHTHEIDIHHYSSMIYSFDELYRSTLQVIAPDPIVFLFFIQTLLALYEEFEHLPQFFYEKKS